MYRKIIYTVILAAGHFLYVDAQEADAAIGIPQGCYYTPEADCYVPVGVPVRFHDKTEGYPTEWEWTFEGAEPATSDVQNPEVTYPEAGNYFLMLKAGSDGKYDRCVFEKGVQAGGTHSVWNIRPEEQEALSAVQLDILGWYGYYAGSNSGEERMTAFAEKFAAPVVKSEISGVDVYFALTNFITEEAVIEVSVCLPDERFGRPSDKIASASLPVTELRPYDSGAPTVFEFDKPVVVDSEFFVVVDGIPCEMGGREVDEVVILCSPGRGENGLSTVYSRVERQGSPYWREDKDRHLSMAVAPVLTYLTDKGAVQNVEAEAGLYSDGLGLHFNECYSSVAIYDLSGSAVRHIVPQSDYVALDGLQQGIYIVVAESDGAVDTLKFIKR